MVYFCYLSMIEGREKIGNGAVGKWNRDSRRRRRHRWKWRLSGESALQPTLQIGIGSRLPIFHWPKEVPLSSSTPVGFLNIGRRHRYGEITKPGIARQSLFRQTRRCILIESTAGDLGHGVSCVVLQLRRRWSSFPRHWVIRRLVLNRNTNRELERSTW